MTPDLHTQQNNKICWDSRAFWTKHKKTTTQRKPILLQDTVSFKMSHKNGAVYKNKA